MHPLHDYVASQLAARLTERSVVVWYDPRREFAGFFDELRGGPSVGAALTPIQVGAVTAQLAEFAGSMFELRAVVEPVFAADTPGKLVLYLPGQRSEPMGSVLLELELAGIRVTEHYALKTLARHVLGRRFTEGVIDDLVQRAGIGWAELAAAAAEPSEGGAPSVLKLLWRDARDGDDIVARWLASDGQDAAIAAKDGLDELRKLVRSRLGLELPADAGLGKLRAIVLRYVLAGEFRSDLRGAPPGCLASVPVASNGFVAKVRACAHRLRIEHAGAYATLADRVEDELGLRQATVAPAELGGIDTFRFEERSLLDYAGTLIASGRYSEALEVVKAREHSYWIERDVERKAQWQAVRLMAELGACAVAIRAEVAAMTGSATAWVEAYAAAGGWHQLDLAQRRLEEWLVKLGEDCAEAPLAVVRQAYEETNRAMTLGFVRALDKAAWQVPEVMAQTRIYDGVVAGRPRPVAYLLVDAMRYEMGVELVGRLPANSEVAIRPAIAALPSITTVGMAALLPGAGGSFAVVERGDRLGVQVGDAFLPDLAARQRYLLAKVPDLADLTLDQVLKGSTTQLGKLVKDKQVVIVRSQEIDHAGEHGFSVQARQIMDTVIHNLARALRRLAVVGVEHAVVTADHGHLFHAADRDPSQRLDAPGGATVELHRRCWIGRGGATPAGALRVAATTLGYASDLDLVFPAGPGVFRAGGDLAFHHGGPSLPELVVPVVTVRTKAAVAGAKSSGSGITAVTPEVITSRGLSATLALGAKTLALFANPLVVRPLLVAAGRTVAVAGMVSEGEIADGCVTLVPGRALTVGFLLADPEVKAVRLVVQDPATDAELYQSAEVPVRLGM